MMRLLLPSCLLALATPAWASQTVTGTALKVGYNSNSSWNYGTTGLQAYIGSTWVDFSYGVQRWQYQAASYRKGVSTYSYYAQSSGATWTVTTESDTSTSTEKQSTYVMTAGDMTITRTETWDIGSQTMVIWYSVKNGGSVNLTDVRLMYGVDAEQDYARYGVYYTKNDTVDSDGDATNDWVESVGPSSGYTIGFGACDESTESVGHAVRTTSTSTPYTDYGGSAGYNSMHWRHTIATLTPGSTEDFGFVLIIDDTEAGALATWEADGAILCGNCPDLDGDGYYDDSCGGDDCDDTEATTYPSASEYCDLTDNDCDGSTDEDAVDVQSFWPDGDGDGYGGTDTSLGVVDCFAPADYVDDHTDCVDTSSAINPGEDEICDGIDNDCNGTADESSAIDASTWYRDQDGDGYGNPATTKIACNKPTGYVANNTDCSDSSSSVHPSASEYCDLIDNDCDGSIDEGEAVDGATYYRDLDSDTYGDGSATKKACSQPAGYTDDADDCDDTNDDIHPGASERCNVVDDDCDGAVDEGTTVDGLIWYRDLDADGYGDETVTTTACDEPAGYAGKDGDCDDRDDAVSPGADEVCNGEDDDCDGTADDYAVDAVTWYVDLDDDGFGTSKRSKTACDQPSGYADNIDDCDDYDDGVNPDAPEVPYDGEDQDCDGADLIDVDGDGYAATRSGGDDCADTDEDINPGATEFADGVDENCDGVVDDGTSRGDDDGDGFTEAGGDCDDADPEVNPGALEDADGVDDDCDDDIDEGTTAFDDDGDGYSEEEGDCDDSSISISPVRTEKDDDGIDNNCDGVVDGGELDPDADGWSESAGDCVVDDPTVYPGATELADGQDNDCDGRIDEDTLDGDDDGDGFTENEGDCDDTNAETSPDGFELPNGVDEDCDGLVDDGTDAADDDGDGYTEYADDCDDSDALVNPAVAEAVANGVDDDCDGQVDEGSTDLDGDGYRTEDGDCDDTTGWARPGLPEMCDGFDNDCDGNVDEDACKNPDTATTDTGSTTDSTACGCATGAPAPGFAALVLGLTFLRRRRATR